MFRIAGGFSQVMLLVMVRFLAANSRIADNPVVADPRSGRMIG